MFPEWHPEMLLLFRQLHSHVYLYLPKELIMVFIVADKPELILSQGKLHSTIWPDLTK